MTNVTTTTVNGWSNWQTYYVASEIISTCHEDYNSHDEFSPEALREQISNVLTENGSVSPKINYIVSRFISKVNFYEISESIEDDFNSERINEAEDILLSSFIPEMRAELINQVADYLKEMGIQNHVDDIAEDLVAANL